MVKKLNCSFTFLLKLHCLVCIRAGQMNILKLKGQQLRVYRNYLSTQCNN